MSEPFGTTCPLLKIAKHYGVSYDVPLLIADSMQHGREIADHYVPLFALPLETINNLMADVRYISDQMAELRNRGRVR